MCFELLMAVVVEALDGRFLDGPVHAFDLAIGPWMLDLGEAVLDAVFSASHVEHVGHVTRGWPVGVSRREGELDAIVGQDDVDLVWYGRDQGDEEGRCGSTSGLSDQLHEGEFAGAIDGDIEI